MVEIVITESAWDDLDSIMEYIAKDSPRYAREFSERIFGRIDQLTSFPESGRIVPEYNDEMIKELVLGRYRIVYRIYDPSKIVVLRIVHGAKLLD